MSLKGKRIWSYILSLILIIILVFSLGAFCQTVYQSISGKVVDLTKVVLMLGALYGVTSATYVYAKFIRTSKQPIPFVGVNIPNQLYDEYFKEEVTVSDDEIIKENNQLNDYIVELESLLDETMDEIQKKDYDLEFESHISDIYIRHHKNASRLVRSFLQLINEGNPSWKWEFCNNVLDECNTVLLKDNADKSSSIFFVNSVNELEMFAYNRIEFSSSRKRRFRINEGFAGHVWSYGKTILVNDINQSNFFKERFSPKHEYGSILGIPIKIGEEVFGVLNIQSEHKDGFTHDDERSVRFYADMCALAHFYDKIIDKKEGM